MMPTQCFPREFSRKDGFAGELLADPWPDWCGVGSITVTRGGGGQSLWPQAPARLLLSTATKAEL